MILLAALLCNYGRGKCLIDIGTEGSAFALIYILFLRSRKLIGAFVIRLCFPFCQSRFQQLGRFAPRTLLRFAATTSPSATLSSSADFPVSPVIRLSAPPLSEWDEEGFSS